MHNNQRVHIASLLLASSSPVQTQSMTHHVTQLKEQEMKKNLKQEEIK